MEKAATITSTSIRPRGQIPAAAVGALAGAAVVAVGAVGAVAGAAVGAVAVKTCTVSVR
jgi:hypothetical protein